MTTDIATQDAEDLESLFDSIVAANTAELISSSSVETNSEKKSAAEVTVFTGIKPVPTEVKEVEVSKDTQVKVPESEIQAAAGNLIGSDKVINQIGHMARSLHETLRELGLNKQIEKAASSIPDARDRLNYVATLTEQAAERVLNATEAAQPLVEKMEIEAHRLSGQWQLLFDKKIDLEQFKDLVKQTQSFLLDVPKQAKETNAYLMEIMMAQDFQDLTGQVIKKITAVTKEMEQQLLALLLENSPGIRQTQGQSPVKPDQNEGLLNGPAINAKRRTDVVSSQDQVDDLLESLGF